MKNETFREICYWGTIGAAALTLINCIVCVVKAIKEYDTNSNDSFFQVFYYPAEHGYSTVLFKVSVAIFAVSIIMMLISFLINTDGAMRIIMIVARTIQVVCIGVFWYGGYKSQNIGLSQIMAIIFGIMELIVCLLYLLERDHRKTFVRVALLAIWILGFGLVFMILGFILTIILCIVIARFLYSILKEPEHKNIIYDATGKVIGFWKRE